MLFILWVNTPDGLICQTIIQRSFSRLGDSHSSRNTGIGPLKAGKYLPTLFLLLLFLGAAAAADLPDPKLTPGAVIATETGDSLCAKNFRTSSVRSVPESEKNKVYAEYGIKTHKAGEYEIDHLISLELGGSNDIKNLWPQSYLTKPWNAHVKDKLENWLHKAVCEHRITLGEAQQEISHDWIASYKKHLGQP